MTSRATRERARDAALLGLAFTAAGIDVWSFFGFGETFTGVMTGNILFLGASLARGDVAHAIRSGIAVTAYVAGCAIGASICAEMPDDDVWSARITRCLALEFVGLCALGILWHVTSGRGVRSQPEVDALIVTGAVSLGLQSVATLTVAFERVTTTYETGMIAYLARGLVLGTPFTKVWLRPGVVAAAATGAAAGAFVFDRASDLLPLLSIGSFASVLGVVAIWLRE